MKRTLAFLLSLMMVLSMLPAAALATEEAPVSEAPVVETPIEEAPVAETPVAQPAEEELQLLADTATLTMSQTADNVVVTYTVPDTTTAAEELQLWKYDSDSDSANLVTNAYANAWEGNTFTWVIGGVAFAEHGEGHYYCTTADGTVESSKLKYAYAQTAVQLAAPTDVVLNGDSLTWTCDSPVMAVIWQGTEDDMNILDYFIEYYWSETEGGPTKYLGGSQEITGYEDYDVFEILQEYLFSKKGKGWYSFHVQAIPADITQYTSSEWSGKSNPIYLTSVLPAVEQPTNLLWHLGYNWDGSTYNKTGLMSFKGTIPNEPPFVDYVIELFRKADGGDVSLGKVETTIWNDRNWATVDAFAFFADEMESGTYYFTVTALPTPGFHSGSEPVKSPEWTYTRPDSELKVTNVSIGSDLSLNWTFDGDLNQLVEYKAEFSFDANGEKPDGNSPYWGDNIDPYGPPSYVPEEFLATNGNGTYYFRIRTVSKDVEVAVPSEWSGWASVQYTAPNIAFEVSNPVWDGSTPTWTDNYLPGAPLLYYQIRYYYGKTADTINYDRCVWDTTYDSLPVQLPEEMLERNGEGYYTFKVNMVSSDLSEAKSSGWSEASPTYKLSLTTGAVNDQLEEINTETTTAADIQEAVSQIENLDKALAADAETGSDETLKTLEKLEAKVKEELKVDTHVEVSDNLAEHFGGSLDGLSFTAANMALNVDTDKADGETVTTVQLNIAAAADSVQPDASKIDADSALVFSMNIENAADADKSNNSTDLKIPVQITLPIPAGINRAFLVILHQIAPTEWEELSLPHVYEKEGQWYATFAVTSFSNYAMGERSLTAQAEGNTVTLQAHLPTNGVQTQYLCAVYSAQGQMLGMGVLQPQSDDQLVITLAQDVPAGATMKIFAPDAGSGWAVHSEPAPVTIVSK